VTTDGSCETTLCPYLKLTNHDLRDASLVVTRHTLVGWARHSGATWPRPDPERVGQEGRRGSSEHTRFDFLGYTFRARLAKGRYGFFMSFLPAMSATARKAKGRQI